MFFGLLALLPAISAFVSFYGLFASYSAINQHLSIAGGMLPPGAIDILREQVDRIVANGDVKLSFGFVLGVGLALWSANAGMKAIIDTAPRWRPEAARRARPVPRPAREPSSFRNPMTCLHGDNKDTWPRLRTTYM